MVDAVEHGIYSGHSGHRAAHTFSYGACKVSPCTVNSGSKALKTLFKGLLSNTKLESFSVGNFGKYTLHICFLAESDVMIESTLVCLFNKKLEARKEWRKSSHLTLRKAYTHQNVNLLYCKIIHLRRVDCTLY